MHQSAACAADRSDTCDLSRAPNHRSAGGTMRSTVSCFLLGLIAVYSSGCKREERVFDPGVAGYTSGGRRFLNPVHAGGSLPLSDMSKYETSAYAVGEGKRLYNAVQLRRMPCPRRRSYRARPDGLRMDIWQPSRPNLFDHRARPAKRHAELWW